MFRFYVCALFALASVGCAVKPTHVSLTHGQMSEQHSGKIASDLVSLLMRSDKADATMVYLHNTANENVLQGRLEEALRAEGWQVEVGTFEDVSDSKADLVIAYRAEIQPSGRHGSYCLLLDDAATTICREYDLSTGLPSTAAGVTGVHIPSGRSKVIKSPKERLLREHMATIEELLLEPAPRPAIEVVPTAAPPIRPSSIQVIPAPPLPPPPEPEPEPRQGTKEEIAANATAEDELFREIFGD